MGARSSSLILLLALPACTDGLGLDEPCSAEMYEVRLERGTPDRTIDGATSERWIYDTGGGHGVFVDFDWGSGACRVATQSFSRAPAPESGPRPGS